MVLIPLGTTAGKPLHARHLPSVALVINGRIVLFDCGEATQFQLLQARLRTSRIDTICITHLHGDHYYGLPGLISTMALDNRQRSLTIIGPSQLHAILDKLPGTRPSERGFDIQFVGLSEDNCDQVLTTDQYVINVQPLDHRIATFGYRLQLAPSPPQLDGTRARALGIKEPAEFKALKQGQAVTITNGRTIHPKEVLGRPKPLASFAYVTDTRPCLGGLKLADDVTFLVHEATYLHDLLPKAISTKHTTALEAGHLANRAGAQALLLFHYSSRYSDPSVLAAEAKTVFANSDYARELESYSIEHEAQPHGSVAQ